MGVIEKNITRTTSHYSNCLKSSEGKSQNSVWVHRHFELNKRIEETN